MTVYRDAARMLILEQEQRAWLDKVLTHDGGVLPIREKLHLPHLTVAGRRYGSGPEYPKILFVGAEAALLYCEQDRDDCCYDSKVQCAGCRERLSNLTKDQLFPFLSSYWSRTFRDLLPAAFTRDERSGLRTHPRTEDATAFWRCVYLFTRALYRRDYQPPADLDAEIRSDPGLFEYVAWANLYKFSYLWHSVDKKTYAQNQGRRARRQEDGFELLRQEIDSLNPDLVVLFCPWDAKAYKRALQIPQFRNTAVSLDDPWYEKVGNRNIGYWQDLGEPRSHVRPIIVRTGHPIGLRYDTLLHAARETSALLDVTRRAA